MTRDLLVRYRGDTSDLKRSSTSARTEMTGTAAAAEKLQQRYAAAVLQSSRQVKTARAAEGDAARKLRIEELRLQELRDSGRAKASQLAQAEDRLARSQRGLAQAQSAAQSSAKRFADAQGQQAKAMQQTETAARRFVPRVRQALSAAPDMAGRVGKQMGDRLQSGFKGGAGKLGSTLKLGAVGLAAAGVGLTIGAVRGFSSMITRAGEAEQSIGAVQATFGRYANVIQREAKRASGAVGLSADAYRVLASTTGSLLKNKGITDFTGQTRVLIKLGSDLAAQYGGSTKDAVDALGSALRGETDPIERYGVSMNQAAIEAEAMASGLVKPIKNARDIAIAQDRATVAQGRYNAAVKEHGKDSLQAVAAQAALGSAQRTLEKATAGATPKLTDQQKAMAALSLISKQTSSAQGAFARETDTYAHKVQVASARWEDLTVAMGNRFLPIASKAMGYIAEAGIPTIEALSNIVGDMAGPLGAASGGFAQFIDFLSTHQAVVIRTFQSGGNAVFDFAIAVAEMAANGSRQLGDFALNGTTSVLNMVGALIAGIDSIPGVDMSDAIVEFDRVRASAIRGATGARDSMYGLADGIDQRVIPGIDQMRDRFNKSANTEIIKAAQRDAVTRTGLAIAAVGTQADGSQIKLKTWADRTDLGARAQKGLMGRINGARTALQEQLVAAQDAGAGQKELTKTWETGKRKLYDEFVQMGLSKKEAQRLADKYAGIKPKVSTKVEQPGMAGKNGALARVSDLDNRINNLNGKDVSVNVRINATRGKLAAEIYAAGKVPISGPRASDGPGNRRNGGPIPRRHTGGPIIGRGGPREDNIAGVDRETGVQSVWVSAKEFITNARAYAANRRAVEAINAGNGRRFEVRPIERRANGGPLNRRIQVRASADHPELNLQRFVNAAAAQQQAAAQRSAAAAARAYTQKLNDSLAVGASAGTIDVSNPRGITSWRGGRFTNLFAANLRRAEKIAGGIINVIQGGFRPSTSYSGTSHAGDAIDTGTSLAKLRAMRQVGIAAGDRTGLGNWMPHVHAVPTKGAGYGAGSAVWQAQDYLRRGGARQSPGSPWGLAGGGPVPVLLRDRGGPLPPGPSIVHNNTGRTEEVLTPDERAALFSGAGRPTVVEVVPDYRGFTDLIKATVRDELRKQAA